MEKRHLDRRLAQMEAEGTGFRTNVEVGTDLSVEDLRSDYDAVVLACGATQWRDLPIPGRQLDGVYQAMEYLPWGNRLQAGDIDRSPIDAAGKDVIIIGGGDTGADCLGTAHRQGAASIHQFEIMPRPSDDRPDANPWPTWPMLYRVSSAHEEGGERVFAVNTEEFLGEGGRLTGLRTHRVEQVFTDGRMSFVPIEDSNEVFPADLVFLAMGFTGPEQGPLTEGLGVDLDARGNVARDAAYATNVEGVYVCGDMGRGQSLIVWAIAEGRSCAAEVDRHLTGATRLPSPIAPTAAPLR
jgi:glutamate synthase (NADPH/NADH) small chain